MGLKKYISELKRRNVFKSGLAYLVIGWLLIQVASIVLPTFNAPSYILKTLLFILGIGFPIWLIFSWVYEITPEGIKKTKSINRPLDLQTNNRLNKVIIFALTVAIALLLFNQYSNPLTNIEKNTKESGIVEHVSNVEKSIAVLAFSDMSPKKDQEYFSDGISEELLNLLAKIPDLRVISRTSSFSYKGKDATTEKIGKELNVSHILEGSVRKSGNHLRITTQLIKVADGFPIWSDSYDYQMEDIFKIQDSIADAVITQLKIALGSNTKKSIKQKPTNNLEAYRLYLQAQYYINLSGFDNIDKAVTLLEQAIVLDPNFALAYAVLAKTYILNDIDLEQKLEWESRAYVAFQEALSLDPNLAEGYVARGMWYWTPNNNFEHEKAIKDFNKAIQLNPGLSSAYESLMLVQLHIGLLDKALETGKKAISIDPTNMWIRHFLGQVYYFQGNYNEALNMYKSVNDKFIPFFRIALTAQTLNYQGKLKDAIKMIKKGLLDYPNEPQLNSTYAIFLAKSGRNDEAKQRMDIAIKNKKTLRHVHHLYHNLASASALMDNKEDALKWLKQAAENGLPCYPLFNEDPNLVSLKGYPSYETFMLGLKNKLEYYKTL